MKETPPMSYDVETTMLPLPPTGDPTYNPTKAAIKSINLMIYLLDNVTYAELYKEKFGSALGRIIVRATQLEAMPGGTALKEGVYSHVDISRQLLDGLESIRKIPGIDDIILGSLFYSAGLTSAKKALITELLAIYTNSLNHANQCELAHFCCPFLYRQESGVPFLHKGALDVFLDYVGDKTMYKLFTEPKADYSTAQQFVLNEARTVHFILGDKSARPGLPYPFVEFEVEEGKNDFHLFSNPFGNYSKCSGGECVTSTRANDWCNDASGSCSAASNP